MKHKIVYIAIAVVTLWLQAAVSLAIPSAQEEISSPTLLEKDQGETCPVITGEKSLEEHLDLIMDYSRRDECSKAIAAHYFAKQKTDYIFYGADIKNPELTMLIINTKTMDAKEKQYWFDILPQMSEEQVSRLDDILQVDYFKGKLP